MIAVEAEATVLTPWQCEDGVWLKREDLYRLPNGVNGAKLRACRYLLEGAKASGATRVISAASLLSPQNAMAATLAHQLGMACTVIVGGTRPATAVKHTAFRLAMAAGADPYYIAVGYNPALQRAAADMAAAMPEAYWLRYGISPPPDAETGLIAGFHETAARQTANLPASVEVLVLPFGSGNTGAGVLHGLAWMRPSTLKTVILMAIGPTRLRWLEERLTLLETPLHRLPFEVRVIDLHGTGFASYGDKMPEKWGAVTLHPTYEGKVVRYLNQHAATDTAFWRWRDGSVGLWIVGGPLPESRPSPGVGQ